MAIDTHPEGAAEFATAIEHALLAMPAPVRRRQYRLYQSGKYAYRMCLCHAPNGRLLSLGGGVDATLLALGELGMDVTVVDNYCRPYYVRPEFQEAKAALQAGGVRLVEEDLLQTDLDFAADASIDCIASFDCLEHLHHSPKHLLERCVQKLRVGGRLVLSVPNAVNLLKRFRVAVGRTNYGGVHEFYWNGTPYTGHVREWTAAELLQLADWLGLRNAQVLGRNWMGHERYGHRAPRALREAFDRALRLRPSLCSNLCLVAWK